MPAGTKLSNMSGINIIYTGDGGVGERRRRREHIYLWRIGYK